MAMDTSGCVSRISMKKDYTFKYNKEDAEDVSYFPRPMHINSLWKFKVKKGKTPEDV